MIQENFEYLGKEYILESEFPLTYEQKVLEIQKLVTGLKKYVGQQVTIQSTPTGGNGNFTVVFKKDAGTANELILPTSGGPTTFNTSYNTLPADNLSSPHTFTEIVSDTCIGNQVATQIYNVYIVDLTNISANYSSLSIAPNYYVDVVLSCTDTVIEAMTTYLTMSSSISPVSSYITVTNLTPTTARINMLAGAPASTSATVAIKATSGSGVNKTVNITVNSCGTILPNMTVS